MNYVFEGYTANPDDPEQWANSLMLEVNEDVAAADLVTPMPIVQVETNYKPAGRVVNYPVRLTPIETLKTVTALVSLTQNSIESCAVDDGVFAATHDDSAVLGLLEQLAECDSAIWELRTWLHSELRDRRQHQDDETVAAANAPANDTKKGAN